MYHFKNNFANFVDGGIYKTKLKMQAEKLKASVIAYAQIKNHLAALGAEDYDDACELIVADASEEELYNSDKFLSSLGDL